MKVSAVPFRELGPAQVARWSEILAAAPSLDSPYFTPGFQACAAQIREGVEVGVLEDGGRIVGFFPFERGEGGVGYPVGRNYSDFQGVVVEPAAEWSLAELVRGCRLAAWRFDHLLTSQRQAAPHVWSVAPSPYVDLSGGFEGWRAERKRVGSKEVEKLLYEVRKAERRVGALRFQLHVDDAAAFETLRRWKGAQLVASGQADHISAPWVGRFLEVIRRTQVDGFAGVLSTLHLGDKLAAVHLGMRTPSCFHYWLPAYDPALSTYSPGQLLFLEIAKAAAGLGARRIDLGKGQEAYKTRLMSGALEVADGAVHLNAAVGAIWRARHRAVAWARKSPLRDILRGPARWLRRATAAPGGG